MIKIYNDRIVFTNSSNKKSIVPTDQFLMYLNEHVELDKNTTFGTILSLLYLNRTLTDILFYRTMGGYKISEFYGDMTNVVDDKNRDYKSEYLEVYAFPDIWKFKKGERYEYNHSFGFHLVKPEDKEGIPYSISFTSLNTLSKHRIKINKNVDFYVNDTTKKITKKTLRTPILKTEMECFRLYDFLWAILFEISWHGSPKERDQTGTKLMNTAYDIENGLVKTIPFDPNKKPVKKKKPTLRD